MSGHSITTVADQLILLQILYYCPFLSLSLLELLHVLRSKWNFSLTFFSMWETPLDYSCTQVSHWMPKIDIVCRQAKREHIVLPSQTNSDRLSVKRFELTGQPNLQLGVDFEETLFEVIFPMELKSFRTTVHRYHQNIDLS